MPATDAATSRYMRKKGADAEALVAAYLRDHGFVEAERRRMRGRRDAGDIAGIPGVVIEVKAQATIVLGKWTDEAVTEATNVGPGTFPLVIVKRKGTLDVGKWFAATTVREMAHLMHVAGYD